MTLVRSLRAGSTGSRPHVLCVARTRWTDLDGVALFVAVLKALASRGECAPRTVVSTHFHNVLQPVRFVGLASSDCVWKVVAPQSGVARTHGRH